MAFRKKKLSGVQSAYGKNVIISNRKKWKFFGNCSNKWIAYSMNEITLDPGSTPVSLISIKENGQYIREFKLKCIWNSATKRETVTEWHQLDPWDELQHESDMIWDCDQLMEYQTESESVVIDFASSDQTGVSCHTTSFNCREKQKLVAENIFIEGLHDTGFLTDIKSEYEINLKFGHSLMDPLLKKVNYQTYI